MGRGVAYATDAVERIYFPYDFDDEWEFYDLVDNLRHVIKSKYPSVYDVDTWIEREVRVIAENTFAKFTISEYCGMVCVCLVPNERDNYWGNDPVGNLTSNWCNQICAGFVKLMDEHFKTVGIVAHGSNGIPLYQYKS